MQNHETFADIRPTGILLREDTDVVDSLLSIVALVQSSKGYTAEIYGCNVMFNSGFIFMLPGGFILFYNECCFQL